MTEEQQGQQDQPSEGGSGEWVPAFPGQRLPFQPGEDPRRHVPLVHGAYAPRKVEPLAAEIVQAVLADDTVPAYVKSPAYRLELLALGRAEAQTQLLTEWLMGRAEEAGTPVPDPGDERVRSAYLLLHRAEARASSARARLGLTPVSAARLGKDVAVGRAAEADVAQRMALLAQLQEQGWRPPEVVDQDEHEDTDDEEAGDAVDE